MTRARHLKIRGQNWRIVLGRPPQNLCDGVCDYDTRTIYISPNRAVNRTATTIHEILHACFPDLEESAIEEAEAALVKGLELVS